MRKPKRKPVDMMEFWKRCEGQSVEGLYPLRKFLSGGERSALFLTEREQEQAVIRLIRSNPEDSEALLARWNLARELSHPHLIRVFATGRCKVGDRPMLYLLMEHAEENLSHIVPVRPLGKDEASQMLEAVVDGLGYLHGKGLVHGHLKPANIMAVGESIKLSSDGLERSGTSRGSGAVLSSYDPPEAATGALSPAGDIWSLGIVLVETLTQRLPDVAGQTSSTEPEPLIFENLPNPFLDIVGHCLRRDPNERWTVSQIAARLGNIPSARSEGPVIASEPQSRKWIYVGVAAMAIIFAVTLVWRKPSNAVPDIAKPTPPPPTAAPIVQEERPRAKDTPTPVAKSAVIAKSTPAIPRRSGASGSWNVVIAEYARLGDAQRRADQIRKKWPEFHAEVYAPNGEKPPHLVILGSELSREDALALRDKARATGLPQDTYMRRLPKLP